MISSGGSVDIVVPPSSNFLVTLAAHELVAMDEHEQKEDCWSATTEYTGEEAEGVPVVFAG